MKRKALEFLKDWFSRENKMPLLIRGARQVGKTTLVELFCAEAKLELIKVNLERKPLQSVEEGYNVDSFLKEISALSNMEIPPQDTESPHKVLIFLDEIQASPKSIVMLRYLHEERPDLTVIAAGSLLEFLLNDFPYSMPVGRIEYFHLGPMTFIEFLMACGDNILVNRIGAFPIDQTTFALLEKKYREYLFVGGMPAAVKEYLTKGNPENVRKIHQDILYTYKDDINKYTKGSSTLKTSKVFDRISGFIGRKFKYSEFLAEYPARDIRKSLDLLSAARVIHFCFHTNATGLPLKSQIDESVFKIYFLDVGLYNTEMGTPWESLLFDSADELLNKGVICEQFVAQHLAYLGEGSELPALFYWLKDKKVDKAEVDFIVSKRGEIYPLEVKSGATGHLKSLSFFMLEKKYKKALRLDLRYRPTDYQTKIQLPLSIGEEKHIVEYHLENWPVFFIEAFKNFQ